MGIIVDRPIEEIGSWQEVFKRTCSERIKTLIEKALAPPEICLEYARIEKKVLESTEGEPRIIQRAKMFATYLRDETISIEEGELIVGAITTKRRGTAIHGELYTDFIDRELDDPQRDPVRRQYDRLIISPEERRELREEIIPYFKGRTLSSRILSRADDEVKEKGFVVTATCPHHPNAGDGMLYQSPGHMLVNYKKVLQSGLKGIRQEVKWRLDALTDPSQAFVDQRKKVFYEACLIVLEGAADFARRYAVLAKKMAANEKDAARKKELERIAEVCTRVPENPARNWWEALQSVWFTHLFLHAEQENYAISFGRFDQYMYPYYRKSVLDDKAITRDEALELLECFWIKDNGIIKLFSYGNTVRNPGFPVSHNLLLGGQTPDGKDAVNEVSYLCLDAEEQVGLAQPDIGARVWEGSPHEFIKRGVEIIRLGRGKMKFYGDRTALRIEHKAYRDLPIEALRDYAIVGCVEIGLPGNSQTWRGGKMMMPKLVELVMSDGKCMICGRQIGPHTGDPREFETMEHVRQAFRKQAMYWIRPLCKSAKVQVEVHMEMMPNPFASCLIGGCLEKGIDIIGGGPWYTAYGLMTAGVADAADSLAAVDQLVFKDKRVTMEQLMQALKDNFEGHEELRQLLLNAPHYGNDDEFADSYAAFVMDVWADAGDYANTQKDLVPSWGGEYRSGVLLAGGWVYFGELTGALPNGRKAGMPISDNISPRHGVDRNGPTGTIKSASRLPNHRMTDGVSLNLRVSPQVMATDADLDRMVGFVRAFEELGCFHMQFNVVSSQVLRRAMERPEEYRDLIVRVGSYCTYFVELERQTQLAIIDRTEHGGL